MLSAFALNGYFLCFSSKCAEDANVPIVNNDLLLCRSGIAFSTFPYFNPFNKQIQKLTGQLGNLGVTFGFLNEPRNVGDGSLQFFDPFHSLRDSLLQATLLASVVGGQYPELLVGDAPQQAEPSFYIFGAARFTSIISTSLADAFSTILQSSSIFPPAIFAIMTVSLVFKLGSS